jgi:15-cis-phytoene synthase
VAVRVKTAVLSLFKASSFAPAFLLLPADRRRALAAVYAFARAVDDAVDDPGGVRPQEELDRWRRLLTGAGEPAGAPPAWPALEAALEQFPINRRHLLDLIDGVARDISPRTPETFEDFKTYCYGVASTVGLACLPLFGLDEFKHRDFAVSLGWAVQTVNILRDVRKDALDGRIYLPAEDLRRFGVAMEDLRTDRLSPAMERLLRFEASRAHDFFGQARRALPEASRRSARPALLMGLLYERLLKKLERGGFYWARPRPRLTWGEKIASLAASLGF